MRREGKPCVRSRSARTSSSGPACPWTGSAHASLCRLTCDRGGFPASLQVRETLCVSMYGFESACEFLSKKKSPVTSRVGLASLGSLITVDLCSKGAALLM